jgi:hypothetical protein
MKPTNSERGKRIMMRTPDVEFTLSERSGEEGAALLGGAIRAFGGAIPFVTKSKGTRMEKSTATSDTSTASPAEAIEQRRIEGGRRRASSRKPAEAGLITL